MSRGIEKSISKKRYNLIINFKLLSGIVAGYIALLSPSVLAVENEKSVVELQAEVAQLKQEILALKQNTDKQPENVVAINDKEILERKSDSVIEQQSLAKNIDLRNASEIVVVAQKTTPLAAVKETPVSISVVSGEELEKFETSRFQDVLKKLGNIRIAGATGLVTGQNLSIRGIGYPG